MEERIKEMLEKNKNELITSQREIEHLEKELKDLEMEQKNMPQSSYEKERLNIETKKENEENKIKKISILINSLENIMWNRKKIEDLRNIEARDQIDEKMIEEEIKLREHEIESSTKNIPLEDLEKIEKEVSKQDSEQIERKYKTTIELKEDVLRSKEEVLKLEKEMKQLRDSKKTIPNDEYIKEEKTINKYLLKEQRKVEEYKKINSAYNDFINKLSRLNYLKTSQELSNILNKNNESRNNKTEIKNAEKELELSRIYLSQFLTKELIEEIEKEFDSTIEIDKEDKKTKEKIEDTQEKTEYIDKTEIEKPRERIENETEEEYLAFLDDYYRKHYNDSFKSPNNFTEETRETINEPIKPLANFLEPDNSKEPTFTDEEEEPTFTDEEDEEEPRFIGEEDEEEPRFIDEEDEEEEPTFTDEEDEEEEPTFTDEEEEEPRFIDEEDEEEEPRFIDEEDDEEEINRENEEEYEIKLKRKPKLSSKTKSILKKAIPIAVAAVLGIAGIKIASNKYKYPDNLTTQTSGQEVESNNENYEEENNDLIVDDTSTEGYDIEEETSKEKESDDSDKNLDWDNITSQNIDEELDLGIKVKINAGSKIYKNAKDSILEENQYNPYYNNPEEERVILGVSISHNNEIHNIFACTENAHEEIANLLNNGGTIESVLTGNSDRVKELKKYDGKSKMSANDINNMAEGWYNINSVVINNERGLTL